MFTLCTLAVVLPNPTKAPHKDTHVNDQKPQNELDWGADDWTAAFTAVIAIIGIGQAFLFWWQLRLIRDGAEDTANAAKAAMASAQATAGQLKLVESLERPWVFFDPPRFGKIGYSTGIIRDVFPEIDFTLRNFGRSPAVIESTNIVLAVLRDPPIRVENGSLWYVEGNSRHPKERSYYVGYSWTDPVIPPGECFSRAELNSLTLTEQQRTDIATGAQRLWIDGCVTYSDVFGREKRQTQFRFSYDYLMDMLVQEGGRDFNWQR